MAIAYCLLDISPSCITCKQVVSLIQQNRLCRSESHYTWLFQYGKPVWNPSKSGYLAKSRLSIHIFQLSNHFIILHRTRQWNCRIPCARYENDWIAQDRVMDNNDLRNFGLISIWDESPLIQWPLWPFCAYTPRRDNNDIDQTTRQPLWNLKTYRNIDGISKSESFYNTHDGVMTWKRLPYYWPFVRGI